MNVTPTTVSLLKPAGRTGLRAALFVTLWTLLLRLALWGNRAWECYDAFDNSLTALTASLFS